MEKIKDFLIRDPHERNLSLMVACELIEPGELWIHIDDSRKYSLSEKLAFLREGFARLARLLQNDPDFKDVKMISGMSWIIAKNPKLVQSLGFAVTNDLAGLDKQKAEYDKRKDGRVIHQDMEPGYAYIDREKFVELYGSHNSDDEKSDGKLSHHFDPFLGGSPAGT